MQAASFGPAGTNDAGDEGLASRVLREGGMFGILGADFLRGSGGSTHEAGDDLTVILPRGTQRLRTGQEAGAAHRTGGDAPVVEFVQGAASGFARDEGHAPCIWRGRGTIEHAQCVIAGKMRTQGAAGADAWLCGVQSRGH
jgi:hypothetical protein